MQQLLMNVPDVTCGHCVSAITQYVSAVPGVCEVEVDLTAKVVTVTGSADQAAVAAAIYDAGYDVEG